MAKISILVFITAVFAITVAFDCSRVIREETGGVLNWLGNITFRAPVTTVTGWTLTLFFDQGFTGVGVWDGRVTFDGLARWAEIINYNDSDVAIRAGDTKTLRFRVNYPSRDPPKPQIISLRFQDVELCN